MYFKTGDPEMASELSGIDKFLLVLTAMLVLLVGVAPQILLPNGI
jgi:hypothetical protein